MSSLGRSVGTLAGLVPAIAALAVLSWLLLAYPALIFLFIPLMLWALNKQSS